jgi:glycerophosphoryl diester phosphodiesterase
MPRRIAVIPALLLMFLLVGLAAAPAHAARNPWRQVPTWNIAHQGGEDEFPSNTLYAFRRALAAGANMLELDIGVTKDGQVVVMHDTTVDRITTGHGTVASKTLAQIQRLDGAYWFAPGGGNSYRHDRPARAYRFRGVATGRKPPPRGFTAADFRVPTLRAVLKAFPHTPTNVEIKGRTKQEALSEYLTNANALARLLRTVHRKDVIVVSFKQPAVDRFHALLPRFALAPGVDGDAAWILNNQSPGPGVVAFQVPITYKIGTTLLQISTPGNVARAHGAGYAWQTWFADQDVDGPTSWGKLIDACVDGVMTARPVAFQRFRRSHPEPASCPRP